MVVQLHVMGALLLPRAVVRQTPGEWRQPYMWVYCRLSISADAPVHWISPTHDLVSSETNYSFTEV